MDESPPPLDDVDIRQGEEPEGEEPEASEQPSSKEEEPLFAEMEQPKTEEEEQEDQQVTPPEPEPSSSIPAPTLEATAAEEPPKPVVKDPPSMVESASSKPLDLFGEVERVESEPQVRHQQLSFTQHQFYHSLS